MVISSFGLAAPAYDVDNNESNVLFFAMENKQTLPTFRGVKGSPVHLHMQDNRDAGMR